MLKIVDAENGKQALDLLAEQPFDLVLLDVHMPVDGATTIKHIRASPQSWNTVPVVALTADAMSGDRERLLALGMTGYATKPIDQRLVAEIMRVCSSAIGVGQPLNARHTIERNLSHKIGLRSSGIMRLPPGLPVIDLPQRVVYSA